MLFGSILAVDAQAMVMVGAIASVSLLALAALYRALVIESFDVTFLRVNAPRRLALIHGLFLALVVVNLVAGFQILGTLMSVGLMMLPAASALLGAQSAADAGDGDGHRRAFQRDWAGVVLLRFAACRSGDRAQRQRHLFRLDPVWNARRHLRLRAPLRSAICKEKV